MGKNNGVGLAENPRDDQKLEVSKLIGKGGRRHVQVALHKELATGVERVRTLVGEGVETLESGEEVGEESMEKWVFGPVRGIGDFRKGGPERDELGVEDLPPSDEGPDGKGGEKQD